MFQKLKEAYTKARYSKHYKISEEADLAASASRNWAASMHQVCTDRIALNSKKAARG